MMVEHFLAVTIETWRNSLFHFLEIQELLGITFTTQKLDLDYLFEQLSVQITPFTPEVIQAVITTFQILA